MSSANVVKKPEIKSLTIIGRRWFQRTYGNTYHSAEIIVNGKSVGNTGVHYGYGDSYQDTALRWLEDNGYIKVNRANGGYESAWRFCDRRGIAFSYSVSDVRREKDL